MNINCRDFPSGPGHLYLYCKEGPKLLHHLIARGKLSKKLPGIIASKRLSRSESDLYCPKLHSCTPDSPMCFRSQTGSEDSGVRVSESSDDSGYALSNSKVSLVIAVQLGIIYYSSCQSK